MTETTTPETVVSTHEQPCFCEVCWYDSLHHAILAQAELLHAALADRLYHQRLERELADEVIHAIPAERRDAILEWVLTWDHLEPRVMVVDCLLDECDSRSYAALSEMARILLDAIHAQDGAPYALQLLISREIIRYSRDLEFFRSLYARP